MELAEFVAFHGPALEVNPARYNLILGLLEQAQSVPEHDLLLFSLDEPGACAVKTPMPGYGLNLGELTEAQCGAMARITAEVDYPTINGPEDSPKWFVTAAQALGIRFKPEPHAQRILALSRPPSRAPTPGAARLATLEDLGLVHDWATTFAAEATEDTPPPRAHSEEKIAQGRRFLWEVDGVPVSMAGLGRRIKDCASIAPVYTPPEHRARGYAGAVTAAVVDAIFAEGRRTACLYTDLSNPYSNRCYARLGFEPVCDAWVYSRMAD
jgi:RimJ/RimL family protein N-acetyltransferase